ncbi:hypothetical protein [Paraburkholderia sp.]
MVSSLITVALNSALRCLGYFHQPTFDRPAG